MLYYEDMRTPEMVLNRVGRDIGEGAPWARVLVLLLGIGACVCVLIALWGPWDGLTWCTVTTGLAAALGATNYLRNTRAEG